MVKRSNEPTGGTRQSKEWYFSIDRVKNVTKVKNEKFVDLNNKRRQHRRHRRLTAGACVKNTDKSNRR